ncbi:hypothetical protein MPOCJGCO_0892 [Methylobacterium trifolii]|uniref:Amino acid transporter n=1 Tax=Methylobacterium trifolii TaxID=1003092 RepID=A0ABQ4TXU0_9HYPH|nr:hypothetical protein MPOCJGCO_0892 [Methylobacterium trifolii]
MSPRETEKTKLSAAYLNSLAVAVFAVGGFAPLFNSARPHPEDGPAFWLFLVLTAGCWFVSGGLHYFARRALDRLPDDDPSAS